MPLRLPLRPLFIFAIGVILVALGGVSQGQQPAVPEFVPNQVIVQFNSDADPADRARARNVVGAVAARDIKTSKGGLQVLPTDLPVLEAVARLQNLPGVEFAEPDWVVRHMATSNDPYYTNGSLWGMHGSSTGQFSNEFGSQAGEAWANGYTGLNSVYVVIIDEGIDFNHQDLSANIWTNPHDPVDGVDNDGNGRIDDIHGWDFFENNNSIYDGSPSDLNLDAHGTHVAGTIGGKGGNGIGVAGVNWNVTMISAKFLGPVSGTTSAAIAAVEYATDLKTRHGLNIVATSNSWGGGDYSEALNQSIIRAAKQNILFIAAAGNGGTDDVGDNNDITPHYPSSYRTDVAAGSESAASYDAVISVASLTSSGTRSGFSNFGAVSVDIGAPGSEIWSTTPQNGYSSYSGTSMATPHVSGAAALYRSLNPSASANDIKQAIFAHGIATSSMSGITTTGKRLNVGDFSAASLPDMTINDVSVSEGNSGTSTATFTATLSASSSFDVSVNFATANGTATASVPGSSTQTNSSATSIPSTAGPASPYPSNLVVPSGLGAVTQMTATLSNFSHTWPEDVDVLLVSPAGQKVLLMSDVGSSLDIVNVNLTFADGSPALTTGQITSGTYSPSNIDSLETFSSPAPAGPYGSAMSAFNGVDPAGTWQLFVYDDTPVDSGTIGSWSLTFAQPATAGDYQSASGALNFTAGTTTKQIQVTVYGDTAVEPSETFTVTLSGAVGANITDAQGTGTITNDDIVFTDVTLTGGVAVKKVHITELRTQIDIRRTNRGLGNYNWADVLPTGTLVQAAHILELREALRQVYANAGVTPPTYEDLTLSGIVIKALHISEIRTAVLNSP